MNSLDGIRILDLSRVLAGPWCTQTLADLGADVIKIERPGAGDDTRGWGPPFLKDRDGHDTRDAAYYLGTNRNKRSVVIDLKKTEGQAALQALLAQADVFLHSIRPQKLAAIGLDPEQMRERHPQLVFATLHANNANQAIDRIIHFFEAEHHEQILMDLSLNLRAIVAQQLIATPDGKGRRAAIEILLNSQLIGDYIRKGEIHEIKPVMKRSRELGMQTFDQALFDLYENGEITYRDAIKHADSPNDLRLLIKLESKSANKSDENELNFSLQSDDNSAANENAMF